MRAKQGYALVGLLGVLVLGSPTVSEAQWVLYDDFSAASIDPDRWSANFATSGGSNPTLDISNLVRNGKLFLALTQYGLTTQNTGTSGGQARLAVVASPGTIIGMQAGVKVKQATVDTCLLNTSTGVRARAQIDGGIFNDGSGGGSNRTGDIIAGIQQMRDTNLGDVFQAFLVRCGDSTCSSTGNLLSGTYSYIFITTWQLNEAHTMSVLWDKPNKQFHFSVVGQFGAQEDTTLTYTDPDSILPANNFKQLTVNNSAANCTGSRKLSSLGVLFDNVKLQRTP
jgi:hypothetical protein